MRLCFPVDEDRGPDSLVSDHFGQAAGFVIVDSESLEVSSVVNPDDGHAHGQCRPVALLAGAALDAIVVGGIGAGAIMKLAAQGTRVFRAAGGTVRENVELFNAGRLAEMSMDAACAGHAGQASGGMVGGRGGGMGGGRGGGGGMGGGRGGGGMGGGRGGGGMGGGRGGGGMGGGRGGGGMGGGRGGGMGGGRGGS